MPISFPEIGYGNYIKQPLKWATQQSIRWATKLLPVHDSLRSFDYEYDPAGAPRQGYQHLVPRLKSPTQVVLNGYDPERWFKGSIQKDPDLLVTAVSSFTNPSIIPLKGLDLIIEVAARFPAKRFEIIGLKW